MLNRLDGLWRHPDFLKCWSAQSLSLLGIQFGRIALPLVAILTLQATAAQVGLLLAIAGSPWLVFGLFTGIVIDRLPRRPILIIAHAGRGILVGSVPACAALGILTMNQLYLVTFLAGTLDVCFQVAYRSYLPSLVPAVHLPDGYAKLAVTDGAMRTAGPSLAGGLVQILNAAAALGIQALTFVLSGLLLWRVRHQEPSRSATTRESVWPALVAGLRFAWRQPLVRAFTLSDATFVFSFAIVYAVQMVFFARDLNLSPAMIGVIFTVGSLGGLLGGLAARAVGVRLTTGRTIFTGSLLRAAGIALVPLAALVGPAALPLLVLSRLVNAFGWTLWEVHQETTQQLLTPSTLRGRVNGSVLFIVQGVDALGGFVGAGLAPLLGVLPTLAVGAIGALAGTAWLATSKLWRLRTPPPPAG
ncbi:MFS transporter [Actinopolymorpha sp. B11F2]|uniref:MFS transporter n=1 Tax=Actinopolymorpha sp. B11F2 TaxID=3160862 RepID=UPI0032E394B2